MSDDQDDDFDEYTAEQQKQIERIRQIVAEPTTEGVEELQKMSKANDRIAVKAAVALLDLTYGKVPEFPVAFYADVEITAGCLGCPTGEANTSIFELWSEYGKSREQSAMLLLCGDCLSLAEDITEAGKQLWSGHLRVAVDAFNRWKEVQREAKREYTSDEGRTVLLAAYDKSCQDNAQDE